MAPQEYDHPSLQEAIRRIDEAKNAGFDYLDLSNLDLETVPEAITQLVDLKTLNLHSNRIAALPEFIGEGVNLESLYLERNRITTIPRFLARLPKLRALNLNNNPIEAIPDFLAEIPTLVDLALCGMGLTNFPDFLTRVSGLQELYLAYNEIGTIPDSISQLSSLEHLSLAKNRIAAIPDSIALLGSLRGLMLDDNPIAYVPDSLTRLSNLEILSLSGSGITRIPDSLARLAKLKELYLRGNQISVIPNSFAQLTGLQRLSFAGNRIAAVPSFFAGLGNLQHLFLNGNQITAVPSFIAQFADLEILGLSSNQITTVPESLSRLPKLKRLDLDGNPLPDELFAALKRGLPSFFRYLESTARRKVYPRTVKLVLLGEPRSGKTTLVEALKGNPHPCDDSRKETLGVNVVTIEKLHPTDREPMYLSVWDFAGQHIEHATHQFFLTESAIYLVLWNARQGTESGRRDLWYWLELLKMRVRDPKFLLVATHAEHTPPDLNLSEIERSYKGCQGNFPVELESLKGLAPLQTKILELVADSASLRAEWPSEWLKVREKIRRTRRDRPYMTPAAFKNLMKENGVEDRESQKDLGSQLHSLGEILYFQERDELCSLVILDPEWVTELIAVVVRSKEVREHRGILRKGDLDRLWKGAKLTATVREHLIRLMDWFDLTYSTGHLTDLGIVVEALPYSTPDSLKEIEFAPGQPQMEMIFRFPSLQRHLPPGIPTWGIARAHRFSTCTPWRDAASFEDRETKSRAVVLASDAAKEVRLRVAADYPPFFFGRMEGILRDTFRRYPGAEPQRRLPCCCQLRCPHSYRYETVLQLWKAGDPYVVCDESSKKVMVESLLSGSRRTDTPEGLLALQSDKRRMATEYLRALNEQMEKTCPSIFTLIPTREFKLLDTWIESVTKEDELELAIYCEHDSGWHPTSHSLYRFMPDQEWFALVKQGWSKFVGVTRYVGPLAKTVGKAAGLVWPGIEIGTTVMEKLPEADVSAAGEVAQKLGRKPQPGFIDIEARYLLKQLIDNLDAERSATEPKNGGLHPCLIEDGRLLWLCPEHFRLYKSRP